MRLTSLLIFLLGIVTSLAGQKNISMADAILKSRSSLGPKNLRGAQWVPGTNSFTHIYNGKLVRVNGETALVDTLSLLEPLNQQAEAKGIEAFSNLPGIQWIAADKAWFQSKGKIYEYTLDGSLVEKNKAPRGADIHKDSYNTAYTREGGLYVSVNGEEQEVAKSEADGVVYGESVHRQEFGIVKGTFWSNSGKQLAFYRMDESMVTEYPIYDLNKMPAQARTIRYPYSGTTSHHVTVGIFDTKSGKTVYLKTGEPKEQYLTNIAWTPDDKFILIAVLNRAQNHMWLNQYNAKTGDFVKTLFEEKHDKWVEPEHPAWFVPGSDDQFVWQSERDGYNHLYLYDLSGKMINRLSEGEEPVTQFYGFSPDGKYCYYQVSSSNGMDREIFRSSLTGKARATRISRDSGTHNARFSKDRKYMLDYFTDAITPNKVMVVRTDKPKKRTVVFSSPNPLDGYSTGKTEVVQLNADDGTVLNARIIKPSNMEAGKKYPAIVYVYNGPHVQLVRNNWLNSGGLWMHRMAEEGYVMFTIDGRGSAHRGLEFENSIFRRLGDLEIADQLKGVEYLRGQDFIDASRIGVFGWSYGGFMTTSLMTRPEATGTFKCGVAGGPVIDWHMYEIMYTERYMDTPEENPEGYEKNSLFNHVDNLNGRLLMIHGSSDDIVLWQHSLRYIQECVKKGKQIDYFVYPEHGHNVRGRDRVHLFEKIEQFFKDNL